jgi:DNA-binding response OmpR family regulator
LVEDSDDEVLLFRWAAEKIPGFRIVGRAVDGEEAIKYLGGVAQYADRERYPWPDIVILEMEMPKRSGLEVLEWMQGKKGMPEVAIFSRTEGKEEKKRALELGAAVYQHKRFEVEVIERFLFWVKTSCDQKATENGRSGQACGD